MAKSTLAVIAFSCPNCGSEIDVIEGYTNTKCKFCNSSLLITNKIGAPRVFAKPKIDKPKNILRERFGMNVQIVDVSLIYVPFIKVSSEIIGWMGGYRKGIIVQEPTYTDSGMNIDTMSTPRMVGEKRVKKRIRRILDVKLDPSEFYRYGIIRVSTEGKKFEVYDDEILHRYGNVFDLPLSIKEYMEKASDMLIDEIIREYRDFDDFEYYLRAIKKKAIVYFNPIYFSRIKSGGELYTYSFDAVDGKALVKDKAKKKKAASKKVFLGLNALYGIIGLSGIIVSFMSFLVGGGVAFVSALFTGFFLWWLQYGDD
jgi:DNA-directed RNA polymerase subunit RPC12/RpoP